MLCVFFRVDYISLKLSSLNSVDLANSTFAKSEGSMQIILRKTRAAGLYYVPN